MDSNVESFITFSVKHGKRMWLCQTKKRPSNFSHNVKRQSDFTCYLFFSNYEDCFFCLSSIHVTIHHIQRVVDCCSQSHCWYWPWSELFIVKLQWKRWVTRSADLFSSVMCSAEVWLKIINEEARSASIKSSRYQVFLVQKQVFSAIQ